MSARTFDLGDVLSISTGYLVSRRKVDALYDVLNFMTGDNLFTHQLPRAVEECAPAILAQHPDLAEVEIPDGGWADADAVFAWLDEQVAKYGSTRALTPLAAADHTHIDPIAELRMMAPDKPIIVIDADGAS